MILPFYSNWIVYALVDDGWQWMGGVARSFPGLLTNDAPPEISLCYKYFVRLRRSSITIVSESRSSSSNLHRSCMSDFLWPPEPTTDLTQQQGQWVSCFIDKQLSYEDE